jgi:hypothetical protein
MKFNTTPVDKSNRGGRILTYKAVVQTFRRTTTVRSTVRVVCVV